MSDNNRNKILNFIELNPLQSSKQIHEGIGSAIGYATVKRVLTKLVSDNLIVPDGRGKATKYSISPYYLLLLPIEVDGYFEKEIDERQIKNSFNLTLITDLIKHAKLFTEAEKQLLDRLQEEYKINISKLPATAYGQELERLAIDLSWKSSQIEGNTYSLLETELLLKEKETAAGKPKDDAVMLLNHKEAINFIIKNPDYAVPLTVSAIEDIHSILVKDLMVDRNIRVGRIGISGTNYKPLDNEYQIREVLNEMCELVNNKESVFEKALLTLVLISYIQPFTDGNKRTARILSNAILIAYNYCPISFRTVNSIAYKKALLVFYEQNNISVFKEIFKSQFEFAVKNYF